MRLRGPVATGYSPQASIRTLAQASDWPSMCLLLGCEEAFHAALDVADCGGSGRAACDVGTRLPDRRQLDRPLPRRPFVHHPLGSKRIGQGAPPGLGEIPVVSGGPPLELRDGIQVEWDIARSTSMRKPGRFAFAVGGSIYDSTSRPAPRPCSKTPASRPRLRIRGARGGKLPSRPRCRELHNPPERRGSRRICWDVSGVVQSIRRSQRDRPARLRATCASSIHLVATARVSRPNRPRRFT